VCVCERERERASEWYAKLNQTYSPNRIKHEWGLNLIFNRSNLKKKKSKKSKFGVRTCMASGTPSFIFAYGSICTLLD